ncbi:MAG: UDP-N-acetylmuramoyl-L-alanine--D-glutamate ligase [Armatimonadota bacterium]
MRLEPARTEREIAAYRAALAGRRAAVIGAGSSGMACVRLLREVGARVTLADALPVQQIRQQADEARALGAQVVGGVGHLAQIAGADLIVSSPGVPIDHPALVEARAAGIEVMGSIELAYRLCAAPIIAITGTNGKGTTCRVLAAMLAAAGIEHLLAGNIGRPLEGEVTRARPDAPAVVEVSSFQLEATVQFRPRVCCILNIAPDHLDRHRGMREYIAAKSRILANQRPEDFAIVNLDDELARQTSEAGAATKLSISTQWGLADAHVRGGEIVVSLWGREAAICPASDLPLRGRHHLANVLVAATGARLLGAAPQAIAKAIRAYRPPEHHMELVAELRGVAFINDTKATNPAAAVADLSALERPFVAIVGGKDKGGDFSELGRLLAQRARAVVLIGEAAGRIAQAMGPEGAAERAGTLAEAVRRAAELAEPGDAVILAPACSSFDMFEDYAHRGRVFREIVAGLASEAMG